MEDLLKPLWGWDMFVISSDVADYILIGVLVLCLGWIGFSLGSLARAVSNVNNSVKALADVTAMAVTLASPKLITAADWEAYVKSLDTPEKFTEAFKAGTFQKRLQEYARSVERHGHA